MLPRALGFETEDGLRARVRKHRATYAQALQAGNFVECVKSARAIDAVEFKLSVFVGNKSPC